MHHALWQARVAGQQGLPNYSPYPCTLTTVVVEQDVVRESGCVQSVVPRQVLHACMKAPDCSTRRCEAPGQTGPRTAPTHPTVSSSQTTSMPSLASISNE